MHGILRTDRLLLRPAASADAPRLIAINEPTASERITQFVENQLNWWKKYSYGLWLIVLPTTENAFALPTIQTVWAATSENNFASVAVMKRAGMSFEAQQELDGVSSVLYRGRASSRGVE